VNRRRRFALVLAVAVVAVAAVIVVLRGREAEPALDASTAYDQLSVRKSGGETVVNALVYLSNRSDKPIELQSASVKTAGKAPSDFRFLVAGPARDGDAAGGMGPKCPPDYFKRPSIKPLTGFTLEPEQTAVGKQGAVLITCFTMPAAPSRFRFTEMTVRYRQDGELRSTTFPNHFALCAAPRHKCDPDGTAQGDF